MAVTEGEAAFLARRQRLTRWWTPVGWSLLIGIGGMLGWMSWRTPLLVNPQLVIASLEQDAIPQSTLRLMAGLLPVAWLLCFLLLAALVLCQFAAISTEKRLLRIIEGKRT
jgi:hypothetical protein